LQNALQDGVEFHTIKSNTFSQIKGFLRDHFAPRESRSEARHGVLEGVLRQAEDAIVRVQRGREPVELAPQNSYFRRLQHELIGEHGLRSESVGIEPFRRVIVLPD
jgi:hypothetical protein